MEVRSSLESSPLRSSWRLVFEEPTSGVAVFSAMVAAFEFCGVVARRGGNWGFATWPRKNARSVGGWMPNSLAFDGRHELGPPLLAPSLYFHANHTLYFSHVPSLPLPSYSHFRLPPPPLRPMLVWFVCPFSSYTYVFGRPVDERTNPPAFLVARVRIPPRMHPYPLHLPMNRIWAHCCGGWCWELKLDAALARSTTLLPALSPHPRSDKTAKYNVSSMAASK